MSALVLIREKNGAGEVATVKNGGLFEFKQADLSAADGTAPLIKPVSTRRSYEKWLRLYLSIAPFTSLTAPKFYTDGGSPMPAGVSIYARTTNASSFSTPAVPADDSAGTSIFTYTSAAKKALDAVNAGPFTGTGDFGDYLVLWMTITSSVIPTKNLTAPSLYFSWDET